MDASIGTRIATYRRRRGLSQAALAGLVGLSVSWLSQVERGVRSVDRLSVLLDLAQVLHVDVEALTGRPWEYSPNGGSASSDLDGIRDAVLAYSELVPSGVAGGPRSKVDLGAAVERGFEAYQAARYGQAVRELPGVLRASAESDWAGADSKTYALAHVLAAKLLRKRGAVELANRCADRAALVAAMTSSPVVRGLAGYQVAAGLLRIDRVDEAEHLVMALADDPSDPRDDTAISVRGSLWLLGSVIAGRRSEVGEATSRLAQAQALAELLGRDDNLAWTAFGPTNVALHRISVAAELGDAGEAMRAADGMKPELFPAGLLSRRAQMHLDLGWAYAQRHRDADATLHLLEAERIAPETIRYNVIVREHVREMLTRGRLSGTSALRDLAVRAGILD